MSEEQNNSGLPQLEEPTYIPKKRESSLAGVAAPVLEETSYTQPVQKKVHLEGVQAPTLADDTYVATKKTHSLVGIEAPKLDDPTAPRADALAGVKAPVLEEPAAPAPKPLTQMQIEVLQQKRAESGQPPYTPEQIEAIQKAYLERQRQSAAPVPTTAPSAAGPQVAPPVLEDPQAPIPEKKKPEAPAPSAASAAALLEEPAPERRISRFNEAEIEEAKANAKKRAIEGALNTETNVDKAESRRLMNELRMQREADLAKKGFTVAIVLMILGLVTCAAMIFFFTQPFQNADDVPLYAKIQNVAVYVGGALGLLSVLLLVRSEGIKKLASFLFGLTAFLMVIPGVFMLMQKENVGLSAVGYGLTLVLSFVVCFKLSTNEAVNMYYKRRETDSNF